MEKGCQRARLARHALNRNNVKDVAKNPMSAQARVALLHITCTSRLLRLMKADSRAVFAAAAKASEACTFIKSFSTTKEA